MSGWAWSRRAVAAGLALPLLFGAAPAKTGAPGIVVRPFGELRPQASWKLGATADWVEITKDAVWVGQSGPDAVARIDPRRDRLVATVPLPGEACAGLASTAGRLWVPLCGRAGAPNALAVIDTDHDRLIRTLAVGPAGEEAGIAAAARSVWIIDAQGSLLRIDARTLKLRHLARIRPGCVNPLAASGRLWITCASGASIAMTDPRSGRALRDVPTGPQPRFLTATADSIWTLSQGDGTVTRIDARSGTVRQTIPLGIPGHGGDIAAGDGKVWTTVSGFPLAMQDAATGNVLGQWSGPGGDSLRAGFGAVWITDYKRGTLPRIPFDRIH